MHIVQVPEWARARAVGFDTIDPKRTALLVVDLQNGFVEPEGCLPIAAAQDIIPNVNHLIDAFRRVGGLVVFIRHTISDEPRFAVKPGRKPLNFPMSGDENFRDGHHNHALYGDLDVRDEDLIVNKHRYSAMLPNSSDLHSILAKRDIDTVVVCGAATNVCCESTARDAAMLDYRVFFVEDATATLNDELHNAALMNLCILFADVRTANSVVKLISKRSSVS